MRFWLLNEPRTTLAPINAKNKPFVDTSANTSNGRAGRILYVGSTYSMTIIKKDVVERFTTFSAKRSIILASPFRMLWIQFTVRHFKRVN